MTIKLKGEEDLKNMTFVEKVKFYVSLCLGTTALLSVFAFLFLIPFVVDPSITTILANFDTVPVICTTVEHIYAEGLSNCSWSSCREGCTSATPRCHQLYVNYSYIPYAQFIKENIQIADIEWRAGPIKFFVNTEGCGYPPRINCTEFAKLYGHNRKKEIFPCFYSKRYPYDRIVAHFDWNGTLKNLILAIGIPNLLFGLSVGILSYWYCWPISTYDDCSQNMLSTTYATFDSQDTSSTAAISSVARHRTKFHQERNKRHKDTMYSNDARDQEWNSLLSCKPLDGLHAEKFSSEEEFNNDELKTHSSTTTIAPNITDSKGRCLL